MVFHELAARLGLATGTAKVMGELRNGWVGDALAIAALAVVGLAVLGLAAAALL